MALKKRGKSRVGSEIFNEICQRIAEGEGLKPMCEADAHLPSWRTVLRFVREDEEAHVRYREARLIQAECMRDQIIALVEAPLPTDPKLAMAEVQRRRLEVDAKDKHIRQMQPSGVRDRVEDKAAPGGGEITIKWGGGTDVAEHLVLEQPVSKGQA
tara:strand:+ start:338 stop:805 length:468 start_codon:yes stop_codon:yes gene_type:complete